MKLKTNSLQYATKAIEFLLKYSRYQPDSNYTKLMTAYAQEHLVKSPKKKYQISIMHPEKYMSKPLVFLSFMQFHRHKTLEIKIVYQE